MQWDDYFSYNPETVDLMWKVYRSSNAKPGDIIRGTKSRNKHLRVNLNRKCYQVHCIIWEMHNGPIPEGYEIDHIDHDRWNNRLSNLRFDNFDDAVMARREAEIKYGYHPNHGH